MRELTAKIESREELKRGIYLLSFNSSYIARNASPGQFLHIKVDRIATVLRRPFSIHRIKDKAVYLLFKVRGRGTKRLSQYRRGDKLDLIGPLGNGFDYQLPITSHQPPILIAGGTGVAPLVFLAEKLGEVKNRKAKSQYPVLLGAASKREILSKEEFKNLGCKVFVATEDGSEGFKGKVTELLKHILDERYSSLAANTIYACGPKEMFLEIKNILKSYPHLSAEVSFEQFMGCGLGACSVCTIETRDGYKKVCRDGPVFNLKEV